MLLEDQRRHNGARSAPVGMQRLAATGVLLPSARLLDEWVPARHTERDEFRTC